MAFGLPLPLRFNSSSTFTFLGVSVKSYSASELTGSKTKREKKTDVRGNYNDSIYIDTKEGLTS